MILTVNGIAEKCLIGTFSLSDNINDRSTLSFSIDTVNTISAGQEVIVAQEALVDNWGALSVYTWGDLAVYLWGDISITRIFGGLIDGFSKSYLRGCGDGVRTRYNISCVDYNQILDRRLIAEVYQSETLIDILTSINANFLVDENITIGSVTNSTQVISQAVFNYISVADAFNYLRDLTGLNYNINYDKVLTWFLATDNQGIGLDDANCLNIELEETKQEYRNAQYVRAGDGTTTVQTKEVPSPKPDGVSKTFVLRFPVATVPTVYINNVAVASNLVGINGLDINKGWYWQKGSKQISQDNTGTPLADTSTISISYQGLKPIIVRADNAAGKGARQLVEGGSGAYENVVTQANIDDKVTAMEYANGLLKKYGEITNKIKVSTHEKRQAGQLVRVVSDNLGIADDYLLTDVAVSIDDAYNFIYELTGVTGEDLGTWVEFFRKLAPKNVEIRDNEILIKVNTLSENQGQAGSYKISSSYPFYPRDTVFPSWLIYPNGSVNSEVTISD